MIIEQAKGKRIDQAFIALRGYERVGNRKLTDAALTSAPAVIDNHPDFAGLSRP